MNFLNFTLVLTLMLWVLATGTVDSATDQEKAVIIKDFFKLSHLFCKDPSSQLINSYDDNIINKMLEANKIYEPAQMRLLIGQVNQFIYLGVKDSGDKKSALMKAINLIIPDCVDSSHDLRVFKDELDKFLSDHQELGEFLTNRVVSYLEKDELTTELMINLLKVYYNHWIPIGNLQINVQPTTTTPEPTKITDTTPPDTTPNPSSKGF